MADHGDFGADDITELREMARILRSEDGKPSAMHLRHQIVESLTFKTGMPFCAELVKSMDPPTVIDPKREELMTRDDVLALVQILKFWYSGTKPESLESGGNTQDAALADSMTRELRVMLANGGRLPELLQDASAFRSGLALHWDDLSTADKQLVRDYLNMNLAGKLTELPPALYARLLGWSDFDIKIANLNKTIEVGRMWQMTNAHLQNLKSLYDSWHAAMGGS